MVLAELRGAQQKALTRAATLHGAHASPWRQARACRIGEELGVAVSICPKRIPPQRIPPLFEQPFQRRSKEHFEIARSATASTSA